MSYDISEILKLSPEERLRIIGDIWDSVEADRVPVPDWHKKELDRREMDYAKNPTDVVTWDEFRKTLEQR